MLRVTEAGSHPCLTQGVPPATLAEFTLGGTSGNPDYYDVSLVDGYNLPVSITNNVNCGVADCPVDLGPDCTCRLFKGSPVSLTSCLSQVLPRLSAPTIRPASL